MSVAGIAAVPAAEAQCPGQGDCCAANGTPGCDDDVCCAAVCLVDPICCAAEWDVLCAFGAEAICGCP